MAGLLASNSVSVVKGSSKTLELTIVDSAGAPVPLPTGTKLYFTVKRNTCDTIALIAKNSDSVTQIEITSATGGIARIYLVPVDTHGLDAGQYVFDVWVVLVSGKRYPVVLPSTFEVLCGVTVIPV